MSKFIEFNDTIVNTKHIICVFPDMYDSVIFDEDETAYLIVMRLDNNSSLEWKFDNEYDRDKEYNWLKRDLEDE